MLGLKKGILVLACFLMACVYVGSARSHPGEALTGEALTGAPQQNLSAKQRASFPHDTKRHSQINCSDCHAVSAAVPDVRTFPKHGSCIGCHNFAGEAFAKPVQFCGICHEGRPTSRSNPALFGFQEKTGRLVSDFGMKFSHLSHLKKIPENLQIVPVGARTAEVVQLAPGQDPKCTNCHKQDDSSKRGDSRKASLQEMSIEKGHSTCFQCHGENPADARPATEFPAMNNCAVCHRVFDQRSPGLYTSPHKANNYNVVESFRHADHDLDIRPKSRSEAQRVKDRPEDFLCSDCHQSVKDTQYIGEIKLPDASYCARCHNGNIGLPDALKTAVVDRLSRLGANR